MSDWRPAVLREFAPGLGRITLVADPDGLLTEPSLSQALTERGFELLLFDKDPVAFRFAYESKYRSRVDVGLNPDLIVVYHADVSLLKSLPFDIISRSRQLSFSLSDFFSHFSYPVLTALDPQYLDLLYEAHERFSPGTLGENATKDFILRHVYGIAAELIKSEADLLRTLLRRHYRPQTIPALFLNRLVDTLRQNGKFRGWPLEVLVRDRLQFFAFLQERWPRFVRRFAVKDKNDAGEFVIAGPPDLPFEDADVRVYIDNLFLEGLLQPVEWHAIDELEQGSWVFVGIRRDPDADRAKRLSGLLELLSRDIPPSEARYSDWLGYAEAWAQLIVLVNQITGPLQAEQSSRIAQIEAQVDLAFKNWTEKHFASLHNVPVGSPTLVHHIPRYLANLRINESISKIALIVVDGMSLDQWLVHKEELGHQKPAWTFHEAAVFAWIPTITSVSRQAIFSGKAPLFFPSTIYSTANESKLWTQFWADHGMSPGDIGYLKALGEPSSLQTLDDLASLPTIKVLGLVIDKIDRILHGMELGTAGMHNQVKQWAKERYLANAVDMLLSKGFAVFLTSDHGNVEAVGCGRPKEGVTAEVRGERVRIYSDEVLRTSVSLRFPDAVKWKPIGLPEDFLPLLAPRREAFVLNGQRTVAHGGITLEELIVPFVQVTGAIQ